MLFDLSPAGGTQKRVRFAAHQGARVGTQKWVRRRNRYAGAARQRPFRPAQKRVRLTCKAPVSSPASEPVSAGITGLWPYFLRERGTGTLASRVYPALARRNGYGLRSGRCGKGCGTCKLSPQKPVRPTRRYRFGLPQIRVRPFAESSTVARRIGFGGVGFSLTNQGAELHVYGLQVVNPYRYRLLVVDGWRTVDNPDGLPTVHHHATSREIPSRQKTGRARQGLCVPVSA